MFKRLIKAMVKKHGLKGFLFLVGDIAVKVTPTKKDDANWAKIKKLINNFSKIAG